MHDVIARLALTLAVLLLISGCSASYPGSPRTTATGTSTIRNDDRSTGAAFFSDDEFERLQLAVVNLDDLATFPHTAKLAPFVRVEVLDSKTVNLHGAGQTTAIPLRFVRVKVLDGPASGRQGWISSLTLST